MPPKLKEKVFPVHKNRLQSRCLDGLRFSEAQNPGVFRPCYLPSRGKEGMNAHLHMSPPHLQECIYNFIFQTGRKAVRNE